MDCSTPGFPVFHNLLEPAQTHVHWVNDATQPSHPLSSPSPPAFNLSQHQGLFQWWSFLKRWPKYWSFSFSISPSKDIQGWFPLGLTGLVSLQSKGLSVEVFSESQLKSINSSVLSLLYGSTLTSVDDYWNNHSFDDTELCMEQLIGLRWRTEYHRAVCCHPVCLTYTLTISWEMLDWMSYKPNQDRQEKHQQSQICRWYHSNGRKRRGTKEPLDEDGGEWKSWLKTKY